MSRPESYSDVILRHYKDSTFRKIPQHVTLQDQGKNTLCGDEVTLYLSLNNDHNRIDNIGFTAKGCMICQASSSLLCQSVKDKTIVQSLEITDTVIQLFQEEGVSPVTDTVLSDGNEYLALLDVQRYPGRKKCALLAWQTLKKMLSSL